MLGIILNNNREDVKKIGLHVRIQFQGTSFLLKIIE